LAASAKDLRVKLIPSADARRIIKTLHYSGKVVNNSKIHFGVFLDGVCGGCLQFGPSMDTRKIAPLVKGTRRCEFLELSRLALADWLPRNSESRAIAYCCRFLAKTYPQLKWIISFADACQCGDGTIYRASGFILTGIKKNTRLYRFPDGLIRHLIILQRATGSRFDAELRKKYGPHLSTTELVKAAGGKKLQGYQLRYIRLLRPGLELSVPAIPYSKIKELGIGMRRGVRAKSIDSDAVINPDDGGRCNSDLGALT
jgi:hypothetical protein